MKISILYILICFCVFSNISFSQSKKGDKIYILFESHKDNHLEKVNFPAYEICIDEKLVYFRYGTAEKVEKLKQLKYPITNRKKLSAIIANDSFENNKIEFYVIEKVGDYYYKRRVDYRFRMEEHDESFWHQKVK